MRLPSRSRWVGAVLGSLLGVLAGVSWTYWQRPSYPSPIPEADESPQLETLCAKPNDLVMARLDGIGRTNRDLIYRMDQINARIATINDNHANIVVRLDRMEALAQADDGW